MNAQRLTGLGKPQLVGKHALFQPPSSEEDLKPQALRRQDQSESGAGQQNHRIESPRRVHITTDLTGEALQIIQQVQQKHRLRTGKVLPLWKAISQAITAYGKTVQK